MTPIKMMTDDELAKTRALIEQEQAIRREPNPNMRIEEWEKTSGQTLQEVTWKDEIPTRHYSSGLVLRIDRPIQILIGVKAKLDDIRWAPLYASPYDIPRGIENLKKHLQSQLNRSEWEMNDLKEALAKLT